jgi:hypothetical protein
MTVHERIEALQRAWKATAWRLDADDGYVKQFSHDEKHYFFHCPHNANAETLARCPTFRSVELNHWEPRRHD